MYGLKESIDEPTRITSSSSTLIDLIFTSHQEHRHIFFFLLSKLCKSNYKAAGLDNISAELLRECLDLIVESLTYIFNQSLLTGIFHDEWKSARVTPLYKNFRKRNDPTS